MNEELFIDNFNYLCTNNTYEYIKEEHIDIWHNNEIFYIHTFHIKNKDGLRCNANKGYIEVNNKMYYTFDIHNWLDDIKNEDGINITYFVDSDKLKDEIKIQFLDSYYQKINGSKLREMIDYYI